MKKIILISLVFTVLFSLSFSMASPSNWAIKEIAEAVEKDLTPLSLLEDFQKNITREEFADLAVRLYESLSGEVSIPSDPNSFSDTNNHAVLKANNLGIIQGIGDEKFVPNDTVTREQIATMFYRTIEIIEPTLIIGNYNMNFADKDKISDWAFDALALMSHLQIVEGVGNNKINPKGTATREQAIALVVRTFNRFESIITDKYILKSIKEGNGDLVRHPDYDEYKKDSTVKLIANPEEGWEFSHWEGDVGNNNESDAEISIKMDKDKFIKANFTKKMNLPIERQAKPVEVEKYLNQNFNKLQTPLGNINMTYEVQVRIDYGFSNLDFGYDKAVLIRYDENPENPIDTIERESSFLNQNVYRIDLDPDKKEETIRIIKEHSKKIYDVMNYIYPNEHLEGYFFTSWYNYPILQLDYQSRRDYGWKDFVDKGTTTYDVGFYFTKDLNAGKYMKFEEETKAKGANEIKEIFQRIMQGK